MSAPFVRINQKIRAPQVRCILADGSMGGIMSTREALRIADEAGLDLVEIQPNAEPPVCKIMDYGKHKYEEAQRKKEQRRNQAKTVIKEVKFHVNVEENDYQLKLRNIKAFLADGAKIKLTLQFRGRENAHKELGDEVVAKVIRDTADVAVVEQKPSLMGRTISGLLAPKSAKK